MTLQSCKTMGRDKKLETCQSQSLTIFICFVFPFFSCVYQQNSTPDSRSKLNEPMDVVSYDVEVVLLSKNTNRFLEFVPAVWLTDFVVQ